VTAYLIRRLVQIAFTVFLAVSFLFFLYFILPGDPATLLAGGADKNPDEITISQIEERYGLDDPILVQFTNYWKRTLQWDLGESYISGRSVNEILGETAPRSIRLAFWALLIEIVVGITVGIISAVRRYSLTDKATTLVTALASALPVFVLGFLLQYVFAVLPEKWGWPDFFQLKTSGRGDDTWAFFFIPTGDTWRYLILPAITLASVSTALAARMMRGSMLEVLNADFMRTAKAKGLSERSVILRHGLRNAMLPVVTLIGLDLGTAIGAAILTETTFSWNGLGYNIANAVQERDAPVMLGLTLVVVIAYAVASLLVDLSYAWFDPRIRLGQEASK
jgi:ABC-type dipeptide/oligopeptide/nickel transport system permease component